MDATTTRSDTGNQAGGERGHRGVASLALLLTLALGPTAAYSAQTAEEPAQPASSSVDGAVGEAIEPGGELAPLAGVSVAPLTFDEFPIGTVITDHYSALGVVFGGEAPFITTDSSTPTSPVLSGWPKFFGDIEGSFERNGVATPVSHLAFDGGYFDAVGSMTMTAYNAGGQIVGTQKNTRLGIERLVIDRAGTKDIASFRIEITGIEPAGFAIDNLTFDRPLVYMALGDSYSSGEGAGYRGGLWFDSNQYLPGTATDNNACHRSYSAYPRQIAGALGLDVPNFWFVACSGAVTGDILGPEGQYKESPDDIPGKLPQIEELAKFVNIQPVDVITVGIGGNDVGFRDIILHCLFNLHCEQGDWASGVENTINAAFYRLADTYWAIKAAAPGSELYVFTYPQIFHPTELCAASIPGIGAGERDWFRARTTHLNDIIKDAARSVGAHIVDLESVFGDEGTVCGTAPQLHGYVGGWNNAWLLGASWLRQEAFHPTPEGHAVIASEFLTTYGPYLGSNPNPAPQFVSGPTVGTRVVFGDMEVSGGGGGVVVTHGDEISVIITDLEAGTVVYTTTFSDPIAGGEYVVDSSGVAAFDYKVPSGLAPGPHTLEVTGTSLEGDVFVATHEFHVMAPGGSFVDDSDSVFESDIEALAAAGITKGCNPPLNDRYCPGDLVTRGQMAAFLSRSLGLVDTGEANPFGDTEGSIFKDDIARLATAEITKGCNPPANDRYCPEQNVTRGQMAAFLTRALELVDTGPGNPFGDTTGSIFESDITRLAVEGITKGCNPPVNDRYCPDDLVTRGQMAAFLTRALELTPLPPPQ